MKEDKEVLETESQKTKDYEELQKIISAVDEVMENTALLDNIKSEKELEQVMPVLLASLGKYAQADRSYIFELKPDFTEILHMTYIWCAKGKYPTPIETQDIFLSTVPNWFSIEEISAKQETHKLTGKKGYIADILQEMYDKIVSEEHQPMMREFWDLSTLPERLRDTESVSAEYMTRSGS